jgi:hypothetical protein
MIKHILVAIFAISLFGSSALCSEKTSSNNKSNDIVGSWKRPKSSNTLIFKEGGLVVTNYDESNKRRWTHVEGNKYHFFDAKGSQNTVMIEGNKLTIRGKKRLVYIKKQPDNEIPRAEETVKAVHMILECFEWLAKYGFIDIIFGIGALSFLGALIRKVIPSNCEYLHVDAHIGGEVTIPRAGKLKNSYAIKMRNSGSFNIYVSRAYFRSKQRMWCYLWTLQPTQLRVHPDSYRIADKDAFELKFNNDKGSTFTDYETLINPKKEKGTFLPLEKPVKQEDITARKCGVLYIEYATQGKQGIHKVYI